MLDNDAVLKNYYRKYRYQDQLVTPTLSKITR